MPSSREDAQSAYDNDIEVEAKAEVLDDIIADINNWLTSDIFDHEEDISYFAELLEKYQKWRNEL